MMRPIVFCKAPVAGRVKTRLIPAFGAEGAMRLHGAMARLVIERALRLFPQTWIAADETEHPFFHGFGATIVPQGEGDLGERMLRVSARALSQGARAVLLLGTDSPHMSESRLLSAARLLRRYDAVFGPVEDGGYDLLALRGLWPGMFDGIGWGESRVLMQSLGRASALGLSYRLLGCGFDVDTVRDLRRAMRVDRHLAAASECRALLGRECADNQICCQMP